MQPELVEPDAAEAQPTESGIASPPPLHIHEVHFYESEAALIDQLARYVGAGLLADDHGIVIATARHRSELAARLTRDGIPSDVLSERYLALDASETLDQCMRNGWPDAERFAATIGPLISSATKLGHPIRVFGEMVTLLAATNHQAALELEELWNDFQRTHTFRLMCAYPVDQTTGPDGADLVRDVIAAHDNVIPAESYTTLASDPERLEAIVVWQQKARWLTAEVARRQQVEEVLKSALAAEQAARRQAESALQARDDFLSIAAHELRTPLTGLSAQVQLLQRRLARDQQPDYERLKKTLDAVSYQTGKIANLIDRLLDVSWLMTGELELDTRPTNLTPLVEQAVASWQATSERATIRLRAEPNLWVLGDAVRLDQVLANLLNNSLKYGPHNGQVDVSLTAPAPGRIELSVRDEGPGIPPAARDHIFEQFFQVDADQGTRGLGLGLYITRQIVELHGGTVHAEFPQEGGTRFVVRLPALDRSPGEIVRRSERAPATSATNE